MTQCHSLVTSVFLRRHFQPQLQFVRTSKISKRRKETQERTSPHLSMKQLKTTPKMLALAFFDDHFGKAFGQHWPSIRLGLLCPAKPCAIVNNFGDSKVTREKLQSLGCQSFKDLFANHFDQVRLSSKDQVRWRELLSRTRAVKEDMGEEEDQQQPEIEAGSMTLDQVKEEGRVIVPEDVVLSGKNPAAAMLDFVPSKAVKGTDEMVMEDDYYESFIKVSDFCIETVADQPLVYPHLLDAFFFPQYNVTELPESTKTILGNLEYHRMDPACLLPVLALNLTKNQTVMDISFGNDNNNLITLLQTMTTSQITAHRSNGSAVSDTQFSIESFFQGFDEALDTVDFVSGPMEELPITLADSFDRVLFEAPSFHDRKVVHVDKNNFFHEMKTQERVQLPETLSKYLELAFRCVRPGGSLIYTTKTMSSLQNDQAVSMALNNIWNDTNMNFFVNDLTANFEPVKALFNLAEGRCKPKYGQLVLPNITNNFGPLYVAKMTRTQ